VTTTPSCEPPRAVGMCGCAVQPRPPPAGTRPRRAAAAEARAAPRLSPDTRRAPLPRLKLVAVAGQHFLTAVVNDAAQVARRRALAQPSRGRAKDAERRLVLGAEVRWGLGGGVVVSGAGPCGAGAGGCRRGTQPARRPARPSPLSPPWAPQYGINVRPAPYYVNPPKR
jgi:hypothetical protein